jgi:hypothetical protein
MGGIAVFVIVYLFLEANKLTDWMFVFGAVLGWLFRHFSAPPASPPPSSLFSSEDNQ